MLVFPQLTTGAAALYPLRRSRRRRSVINTLSDGSQVQYSDPDSRQNGITSFKLDGELLHSFLLALVEKTGMTLRGDIYVKKRDIGQINP